MTDLHLSALLNSTERIYADNSFLILTHFGRVLTVPSGGSIQRVSRDTLRLTDEFDQKSIDIRLVEIVTLLEGDIHEGDDGLTDEDLGEMAMRIPGWPH